MSSLPSRKLGGQVRWHSQRLQRNQVTKLQGDFHFLPHDLDEFVDLRLAITEVVTFKRVLNAGGNVVIENDRLEAGERSACSLHLSCDIDASTGPHLPFGAKL